MADFEVRSVFWFLCEMCVAPVGEGIWSMCNTTKTDRFSAWLSTVAGMTWTPSMSTTDDAWHTDTFSCWRCQRARHSLGRAQNCPDHLDYRQSSVCTLGAKESHRWWQTSLYGPFLYPLDMLHWTKRAVLELKHCYYTKRETRKRICYTETTISLQQRKWKRCHQ